MSFVRKRPHDVLAIFQKTLLRGFHRSRYQNIAQQKIVQENDVIILKKYKGPTLSKERALPILSSPLRAGDVLRSKVTHRGKNLSFAADSIIGKRLGDVVESTRGKSIRYRIFEPTLDEYVTLRPRVVTPIYPSVCNLIVSLLDLHPTLPGSGQDSENSETLEVFEAGTGHGALTLHLARAIQASNTSPPEIPSHLEYAKRLSSSEREGDEVAAVESPELSAPAEPTVKQQDYDNWKSSRRAIIQTLDKSLSFSNHAKKTIKNFRRGLYFPHIDFHIGSIEEYLSSRIEGASGQPVFDHAILDLPDPAHCMSNVAEALKMNGKLIIFTPHITTVTECLQSVKEQGIPLWLENVIEIGAGIAQGGREWEVRYVKPRKFTAADEMQEESESMDSVPVDQIEDLEEPVVSKDAFSDAMICRPKTGTTITAGAFISIWRKLILHT